MISFEKLRMMRVSWLLVMVTHNGSVLLDLIVSCREVHGGAVAVSFQPRWTSMVQVLLSRENLRKA